MKQALLALGLGLWAAAAGAACPDGPTGLSQLAASPLGGAWEGMVWGQPGQRQAFAEAGPDGLRVLLPGAGAWVSATAGPLLTDGERDHLRAGPRILCDARGPIRTLTLPQPWPLSGSARSLGLASAPGGLEPLPLMVRALEGADLAVQVRRAGLPRQWAYAGRRFDLGAAGQVVALAGANPASGVLRVEAWAWDQGGHRRGRWQQDSAEDEPACADCDPMQAAGLVGSDFGVLGAFREAGHASPVLVVDADTLEGGAVGLYRFVGGARCFGSFYEVSAHCGSGG